LDAEGKESEAENMMKQSIGEGLIALECVVSSVFTAGTVVYICVIRILTKSVVPGIVSVWKGDTEISAIGIGSRLIRVMMHLGVIAGACVALSGRFAEFEDMTTQSRWEALIRLALVAGTMESILIHLMATAICCFVKGVKTKTTTLATVIAFLECIFHSVPLVLIECLILLTLFGPSVFELPYLTTMNPALIWMTLLPISIVYVWFFRLKPALDKIESSTQCKRSMSDDLEEAQFCGDGNDEQSSALINKNVDQEYGSMEEISITISSKDNCDIGSELSASSSVEDRSINNEVSSSQGFLARCNNAIHQFLDGLRLPLDVLVICIMTMLLYHSQPAIPVLQPIAKSSLGMLSSWVSVPVMIVAFVIIMGVVHLVFIR
jgi:hypothetical protein